MITEFKLWANFHQNKKTAQTIAEISNQYPAIKTNQSALQLDTLIVPLGLETIINSEETNTARQSD